MGQQPVSAALKYEPLDTKGGRALQEHEQGQIVGYDDEHIYYIQPDDIRCLRVVTYTGTLVLTLHDIECDYAGIRSGEVKLLVHGATLYWLDLIAGCVHINHGKQLQLPGQHYATDTIMYDGEICVLKMSAAGHIIYKCDVELNACESFALAPEMLPMKFMRAYHDVLTIYNTDNVYRIDAAGRITNVSVVKLAGLKTMLSSPDYMLSVNHCVNGRETWVLTQGKCDTIIYRDDRDEFIDREYTHAPQYCMVDEQQCLWVLSRARIWGFKCVLGALVRIN